MIKDEDKEKPEEKKEEDEPSVVLRQKSPQGLVNPRQRYSLPEFDIFDVSTSMSKRNYSILAHM